MRKITEEGVQFRSHLNGDKLFLSPEKAMEIQNALGSDIMMAFDECPPYPAEYEYVKKSLERTTRWAERCLKVMHDRMIKDCSRSFKAACMKICGSQSAEQLTSMDFPGYAIGGLSVGEPKHLMYEVLDYTVPLIACEQTSLFDGCWFAGCSN